MTRLRLRRPAGVDPALWELAPRGVKLALMEVHASTPAQRNAAYAERVRHTARELQRALSLLEGHGPRGEQ
ncbi:hypothetical protein [Deinococcus murrayi]|uniref:hypothetical protein n=1 Tax=Deinococcus murrayi TaxID=68910 RepID=UPI0004898910|nr:hypothetical protein [Deinococcus murrayi]